MLIAVLVEREFGLGFRQAGRIACASDDQQD
jgi:hypothetical protein